MSLEAQVRDLIARRASQWVETLRDPRPEDCAAFVRWVCQSPMHLDAFLVAAGLDQRLNALDFGKFDRKILLSHLPSPVAELRTLSRQDQPGAEARSPRRWPRWELALAAGVAVLAVAAGLASFSFSPHSAFATSTGEQRVIELADGSMVHLAAESHMDVRFNERTREVRLNDGEALFTVAKDAHRPFRVHTDRATVEAIGTQFNVYTRAAQTTVSVLEGRVRVSDESEQDFVLSKPMAEPAKPRIVESLDAGDELMITRDGNAVKRTLGDGVTDSIAWQQRRRVFDKSPLEEIVAEINRYNRSVQIRLENIVPNSRVFSGTFDLDDPYGLAAAFGREPNLQIEHRGSEIIVRELESQSRKRH